MNRETKLIIVAILCVAVLGLTVAYSALSATLRVSGTGSVTAGTWSVGFTGSTAAGTKAGAATCPTATVTGTTVTITGIALTKPSDSCTYDLTIKNSGSINAVLTKVDPATPAVTLSGDTSASTFQPYIKYTVTYAGKDVTNSTANLTTALNATATAAVKLKVEFLGTATSVPAKALTIGGISTTFTYGAA